MATKKEPEKKETKRKPTTKKEPVEPKVKETKKEELVETPIPDPEPLPEGVVEGEPDILPKDEIDEMIETPVPKAKPEKLETLVIDEDLKRAECEKKDLAMLTTGDLKTPVRSKAAKAHDAANDTIITTLDFKPRKWGESKKL